MCSIFVLQPGRCAFSFNTFTKITVWYTVAISACSSPGTHSINPAQCLGKSEWVDFNSSDFQLVLEEEVVGGHCNTKQAVFYDNWSGAEVGHVGLNQAILIHSTSFLLWGMKLQRCSVSPGFRSVRASSMAEALPLQSITKSPPHLRSLV